MACEKREMKGHCGHDQCPYPDRTDHGYRCIEIIDGFCEAGDGCFPECPYAYRPGSTEEAEAMAAFETKYPPLTEEMTELLARKAYS